MMAAEEAKSPYQTRSDTGFFLPRRSQHVSSTSSCLATLEEKQTGPDQHQYAAEKAVLYLDCPGVTEEALHAAGGKRIAVHDDQIDTHHGHRHQQQLQPQRLLVIDELRQHRD